MAQYWRLHKTLAFCLIALTAAGLLGWFDIALAEKAFGIVQWRYILLAAQGYVAWAFYKLLHF